MRNPRPERVIKCHRADDGRFARPYRRRRDSRSAVVHDATDITKQPLEWCRLNEKGVARQVSIAKPAPTPTDEHAIREPPNGRVYHRRRLFRVQADHAAE